MQGNKNEAAAGRVVDLDAQLAARMLKPVPVRLGGHVYQVRTDLTSEEVTKYLVAANDRREDRSVEAFALLVGARDAKRLNTALAKMAKQHSNAVVDTLMIASVALAGFVVGAATALELDVAEEPGAGESSAS